MKLDKIHLDRLLQPDTKEDCLFKLNTSEKCKRKLQRKRFLEDCIEASYCFKCGNDENMIEIRGTVLCTECHSDRIKELQQPKAAGTTRKKASAIKINS